MQATEFEKKPQNETFKYFWGGAIGDAIKVSWQWGFAKISEHGTVHNKD